MLSPVSPNCLIPGLWYGKRCHRYPGQNQVLLFGPYLLNSCVDHDVEFASVVLPVYYMYIVHMQAQGCGICLLEVKGSLETFNISQGSFFQKYKVFLYTIFKVIEMEV